MRALLLLAVVCWATVGYVGAFRGPFNKLFPNNKPSAVGVDEDPGEPLFLTPYIEQGKIDEARRLR